MPYVQAIKSKLAIDDSHPSPFCSDSESQSFSSYEQVKLSKACRDALLKDKRQLKIDLSDIKSFDQELGFLLGNDPTQYLPLVYPMTLTQSDKGSHESQRLM